MVAMAGKYIVYIEKSKLILTHPTGISFDLAREDAKELAVLISNWQQAIAMGVYERELEAMQAEEDKTTTFDENIYNSGK